MDAYELKSMVLLALFFPTSKGLTEVDSLSPFLFDLADDALAIIMDNARKQDFVKGVLE